MGQEVEGEEDWTIKEDDLEDLPWACLICRFVRLLGPSFLLLHHFDICGLLY